jgi:HAD superfamily hydrolase (TIGR01484 family)
MGGTTTIDVTKKGIDKAYGIHQLSKRLKINESDILYVGDELGAGGNDEAVFKTLAQTHAVRSPQDTADLIHSLVA